MGATDECRHGGLRRKCEACDLEEQLAASQERVAELERQLEMVIGLGQCTVQAGTDWMTRAKTAERERDEARRERDEAVARAEKAIDLLSQWNENDNDGLGPDGDLLADTAELIDATRPEPGRSDAGGEELK